MRRLVLYILFLMLASGLGAQNLKLGTIDGMAEYSALVIEVLEEAGFTATVTTYPQPVLFENLAKGTIDGAFFVAQPLIAQIAGAIMVPVRLAQTDFCAVTVNPSIKISSPADLRKYKIGTVKGNSAHAAVTRGMAVSISDSEIEMFRALAAGTIDVAISVDKAVPGLSRAARIQQYYLQMPPLLRTPTFLALSRMQTANKAKIEAVFKSWVESGKWNSRAGSL